MLKKRLTVLLLIALSVFSIYAGIRLFKPAPVKREAIPPPKFYPAQPQNNIELFNKQELEYPFTFIVYGDSREPSGDEKQAIIRRIIEEKPSFVIHLGDMVTYGEAHQWDIFDFLDGRIIAAGIPFYPVIGNHEYYTHIEGYLADPKEQLSHYFTRFPFLEGRHWYSFKYGNSLFLILDTNTDYSSQSPQHKWLMNKLKNEHSKFLFVAFHHPPYTKNKDKSPRKSERFLADIFEGYKENNLLKADIVFSSHTHNYERYLYRDINYVVSGGAGAPQYPVERGIDDLYTAEGDTYHYCKVTVFPTQVVFEMFKLISGDIWTIADSFVIHYNDGK